MTKQTHLNVTMRLQDDTPIRARHLDGRIPLLEIGTGPTSAVTIYFGLYPDDEEIVAIGDRLMDAITSLTDAARDRLADKGEGIMEANSRGR